VSPVWGCGDGEQGCKGGGHKSDQSSNDRATIRVSIPSKVYFPSFLKARILVYSFS